MENGFEGKWSYLQRLITNPNIAQEVKKYQKISEIRTFHNEN